MVLAIPLLLVAKIWAQHTPVLAPWAEFLGPEARANDTGNAHSGSPNSPASTPRS